MLYKVSAGPGTDGEAEAEGDTLAEALPEGEIELEGDND